MKKTLHTFFSIALIFAVAAFTGCTKEATSTSTGVALLVKGNSYGYLVQPAVASTSGAEFTGTYDPKTKTFSFTIQYKLTTRPAITIAMAPTGASSNRVVVAYVTAPNAPAQGGTSGSVTLDFEQAQQLMQGNFYYSLATGTYPGGEIRGQLKVVY